MLMHRLILLSGLGAVASLNCFNDSVPEAEQLGRHEWIGKPWQYHPKTQAQAPGGRSRLFPCGPVAEQLGGWGGHSSNRTDPHSGATCLGTCWIPCQEKLGYVVEMKGPGNTYPDSIYSLMGCRSPTNVTDRQCDHVKRTYATWQLPFWTPILMLCCCAAKCPQRGAYTGRSLDWRTVYAKFLDINCRIPGLSGQCPAELPRDSTEEHAT